MTRPRVDPLLFAVLAPTLAAAHTVGDHLVQTDTQAAGKATNWRAMAGHVAGYQITQALAVAAVLRATGLRPRTGHLLAGWLLSGLTHAVIDRRWPVLALLRRTGSDAFSRPVVRVRLSVDGYGAVYNPAGLPREVEATGPLPLHGPYLADQALHLGVLALAAAVMARREAP